MKRLQQASRDSQESSEKRRYFVILKSSVLLPINAGVHFVLREKNAGNIELVWHISKSYATVLSIPGGEYNTLLNFQ